MSVTIILLIGLVLTLVAFRLYVLAVRNRERSAAKMRHPASQDGEGAGG